MTFCRKGNEKKHPPPCTGILPVWKTPVDKKNRSSTWRKRELPWEPIILVQILIAQIFFSVYASRNFLMWNYFHMATTWVVLVLKYLLVCAVATITLLVRYITLLTTHSRKISLQKVTQKRNINFETDPGTAEGARIPLLFGRACECVSYCCGGSASTWLSLCCFSWWSIWLMPAEYFSPFAPFHYVHFLAKRLVILGDSWSCSKWTCCVRVANQWTHSTPCRGAKRLNW